MTRLEMFRQGAKDVRTLALCAYVGIAGPAFAPSLPEEQAPSPYVVNIEVPQELQRIVAETVVEEMNVELDEMLSDVQALVRTVRANPAYGQVLKSPGLTAMDRLEAFRMLLEDDCALHYSDLYEDDFMAIDLMENEEAKRLFTVQPYISGKIEKVREAMDEIGRIDMEMQRSLEEVALAGGGINEVEAILRDADIQLRGLKPHVAIPFEPFDPETFDKNEFGV